MSPHTGEAPLGRSVAGSDAAADEILNELRAAGLRVTVARRSIVAALLERHDHITTESLIEDVRSCYPDASRATVYRTVSVLDALGLVEQHELGPGPTSYHYDAIVELSDVLVAAITDLTVVAD